jgi:ferredoxin
VNLPACCGHGQCAAAAPDVFELDAEGYQDKPVVEVPAGLEDQALDAVLSCPERCLSLADESGEPVSAT